MSVAAYPVYKDSGVEWIGSVPGDWQVMTLRQLCASISTGPFGTALGSQDYVADEVPVINPSHIADGRCVPDPEVTVSAATAERLASWRMAPGDLVVARRGELGRAALILPAQAGWVCGTGSLRIRPDAKRSIAGYLLAVLQAPYAREWLNLTSVGSTMPNISEAIIGQLPVVVPPTVAAQDAVVDFLNRETAKIDALVAEQEGLMALLKEKRQAVISQAVTKGLDPNAPMKDSGVAWLGEVPAHWAVASVGYHYDVLLGRMLNEERSNGEHLRPYLRVLNVQWGVIDITDLAEMDFPPDVQPKYRLRAGDLLVNEGGSYVGRSAIWRDQIEECYFQKALHRLRPYSPDRNTTEYLYFLMEDATRRGVFVAGANQTTIDHLTAEQLRAHRFPFPPKPEQEAIVVFLQNKVAALDHLTAEAARAIALLRERRAALISAAVTGKIDVRHLAPAAQAAA